MSSPTARRTAAKESFGVASECIGAITPGMSLFAITRGQFSMIDAILHILDEVGSGAAVSIWPRTVSIIKADLVTRLRTDPRIAGGRLIINSGDEYKNAALLTDWRGSFGGESIRHCRTHAKIATIESAGLKFLLRGSLNLGSGNRFEQFDLTEGGADFDAVRRYELAMDIVS